MKNYIKDLTKLNNQSKYKDVDLLIKKYKNENIDMNEIKTLLNDYRYNFNLINRFYFATNLIRLKSIEDKLNFINENKIYLRDRSNVDELLNYFKEISLDFALENYKKNINEENLYARRWAYVQFNKNLYKNNEYIDIILSLIKDDSEYYVIMAEAWLLSLLAVSNKDKTYNFLKNSNISYKIKSKAISKILESFKIDKVTKDKFKKLRTLLKENENVL